MSHANLILSYKIGMREVSMKPSVNNNSWVLSVKNKTDTKWYHHYFCRCTKEFKLQTEINQPEAPDILCPMCGEDYFKDVDDFTSKDGTRVWKYFKWDVQKDESATIWKISLIYQLPMYYDAIDEVRLQNKELICAELRKDGTKPIHIKYKSKFVPRYSLFVDSKVKPLKELLVSEAKEHLYNYIITNKYKTIEWITDSDIMLFSVGDKLRYLTFFLKNPHLKEHEFFFWKMDNICNHIDEHTTQVKMLDFIVDNRKEKSIKKALYKGYEDSINKGNYYPYSDYIFSRTIGNIDLLNKLYGLYPAIKQHIFTDETFSVAIEFILFLKRYYTEKQIVKLFIQDLQDEKEYKNRLSSWRDTLRMLHSLNAFSSLQEHFLKVKLTTKKLHDEIVRVFHIISYELDAKESFEYKDIYLSACSTCKDLEFKLPSTVKELSLWAKILHNCMFGYSRRIHQQQSIIYGVFRADELLYAVELAEFKIVQAKAVLNNVVPDEDMKIIKNWKNNSLFKTQT